MAETDYTYLAFGAGAVAVVFAATLVGVVICRSSLLFVQNSRIKESLNLKDERLPRSFESFVALLGSVTILRPVSSLLRIQ